MDQPLEQTLLLLLLAAVGAAAYWVARRIGKSNAVPYQKRAALLTPAELEFYRVLQRAVAGDWQIFVMVRLVDVISVASHMRGRERWIGPIIAKHLDFVVCDPERLEPVLAIELDDASHDRPERIERDRIVDAALSAAGLPLIRVRVAAKYDLQQLRGQIREHLADRLAA